MRLRVMSLQRVLLIPGETQPVVSATRFRLAERRRSPGRAEILLAARWAVDNNDNNNNDVFTTCRNNTPVLSAQGQNGCRPAAAKVRAETLLQTGR